MGSRGLFSVHISSEKADKDLISGDVYTEACRGGRFFEHTSSVQKDSGHKPCPSEVRDASCVQGGGKAFDGALLDLLKISQLNKYPW
jgi:hypothetical protein